MSARACPPHERRGFALLLVLFVVAAVGVLAAGVHRAVLVDRGVAANARAATRARWAARGALARTLDRLHGAVSIAAATQDAFAAVGDTLLMRVDSSRTGERVEVVVLDARARAQLNRAGPAELAALAAAVGIPEARAEAFGDVVVDWRDADDAHRPHGAERPEYAGLHSGARPKNAAFDAVEELAEVYGVTADAYARLAPYVGVGGDGRVNVNSAPAPVLRTLYGIDPAAAAAIVARRLRAPYHNVYELAPSLPEPARSIVRAHLAEVLARVAFTPRDVRVLVRARAPGAAMGAELEADVVLTGGTGVVLRSVRERAP